jgi:hypothetical protein
MLLYTYKNQSQIQEMQKEGALRPKGTLNRSYSTLDFLAGVTCDRIRHVLSFGTIPIGIPFDSQRKGIFFFLEGYEKTGWTKEGLIDFSALENTLNEVKEGSRDLPITLFSLESRPQDIISIFEYKHFSDYLNIYEEEGAFPEVFIKYFKSEVPLRDYDGSYKLPEAVCFSPIRVERFRPVKGIKDIKEHIRQLRASAI